MGLFNLIAQLRKRDRLPGIAHRIAERSLDEVARRIVGLGLEMSAAETRGYIRARAAVVIHREVNLLLALDHSVRFQDRTWLTHVATEEVVEALVKQAAQLRAQTLHVEAA